MTTIRCSVCDATNNLDVANSPTGFTSRGFIYDNKRNDYLCLPCHKTIKKTLREFAERDKLKEKL